MPARPRRSTERRGTRVRVALRRLGHHLTRDTARWGYLLTALCILGYALVPESWSTAGPVREFLLVLASVAAGAVVLPELPSNLWSLDVGKVRSLVPDKQRAHLAETLVAAESDDHLWNDVVWHQAVRPLLAASRDPSRYVRHMDYDVSVHLARQVEVAGRSLRCHLVSVDSKSTRVLGAEAHASGLWLSVARTEPALAGEFGRPGCLGREIVALDGLSGEAWQQAVSELCSVRLFVGGEAVPLEVEATPEQPDLVRWRTSPDHEPPSTWTTVQIMFDFVMSDSVDTFPVIFSGYYCAGTTDLSLRLYDQEQPSSLTCDDFFGRALSEAGPIACVERSNEVFKQRSFTTGSDSILWPGSGVLFRWSPL